MGEVDKIFKDLDNYTSGYELKYNKFYVGLAKDGIAKNFISFKPKKSFLHFIFKTNENQELSQRIEDAGLDVTYEVRWRQYYEKIIDGYSGFLFVDKNGNPLVAMHWQHRLNHMVKRYNDIYRVQMPNITPHVCRHTYCSNMAKSGMNPKTLQYLMGHSDIAVTLNVYTHIRLDDATEELRKLEEMENARRELEKGQEKPVSRKMFKAI